MSYKISEAVVAVYLRRRWRLSCNFPFTPWRLPSEPVRNREDAGKPSNSISLICQKGAGLGRGKGATCCVLRLVSGHASDADSSSGQTYLATRYL